MKYKRALNLAEQFKEMIAPACKRIEIAGSLRRQKEEVKDIEIVCIPKRLKDERIGIAKRSEVDRCLEAYQKKGRLQIIKNGPRYKQIVLIKKDETPLIKADIFLVVPPAQWGVIFLIRTGPASFSKWIVSIKKPQGFKFKDGRILCKVPRSLPRKFDWIQQSTPEEEDVFKVLLLKWIPVERRKEFY